MSSSKSHPSSFFKSIGTFDAIAVAVAGMAPTLAMNLNPQEPAKHVGRVIPLVFAACTILVLLVAWCFARLSRKHPNAGSAYGFVASAMGPWMGLVAGWALFGTYLSFAMCSLGGFGLFRADIGERLHHINHPSVLFFTMVGAVVIGILCVTSTRRAALALIILEGVAVFAMVMLSCAVIWQVIHGHGPQGDPPLKELFMPQRGVGASSIAMALSFGFLSFAGFEEVATLGEEVRSPRRAIPRVLIGTVLGAGIIFTLVTMAEVLGFGTDPAGITRFTSSDSLLGDLAARYFGGFYGDLFDGLAIFSALGGGLASVVAASRILFAICRDLLPSSPLGRLSASTGTPINASLCVIFTALAGYLCMRTLFHASGLDAFFWGSTLGALSLLVAYFLVVVSAALSFLRSPDGEGWWVILIPLIALLSIGYTFWVNIYPVQPGAYGVIPWLVVVWCLLPIPALLWNRSLVDRIKSGFLNRSLDGE